MSYRVSITTSAQKQFKKLSLQIQERTSKEMLSLEQNPRPFGSQKLRSSQFYRIRIGDYRIIYSINDSQWRIGDGSIFSAYGDKYCGYNCGGYYGDY
jgi:mRNA interferase RelE/StbE